MSFGDLSRINTNIQSLQAYSSLQKANTNLGLRQMRLATGKRINRAEDDSAGYSIAKKLQAKTRGQAQALANIGDAKGMLTVGEGALNSVMDILQTMKEKAVQAANDTMNTSERDAISNQLAELKNEVADVLGKTEFNGKSLFDTDGQEFDFQVGAENGDKFSVSVSGIDEDSLLGGADETVSTGAIADLSTYGSASTAGASAWSGGTISADYTGGTDAQDIAITYATTGGGTLSYNYIDAEGSAQSGTVDVSSYTAGESLTITDDLSVSFATNSFTGGQGFVVTSDLKLDVSDHDTASATIGTIDSAIQTIADELANLGDKQSRLSFKQDNLQTSMTNYEAARSRIEDADFAKEQMEIVKLQILQQTGTASLAQANSSPQAVLSLF